MTVRERLTGPQPYLVDPNDYFGILCCLVSNGYGPAKEAAAAAEAEYENAKNNQRSQEEYRRPIQVVRQGRAGGNGHDRLLQQLSSVEHGPAHTTRRTLI